MRTSLHLCFCLLTLCGIIPLLYGVRVVVEEDSDAVLPCLISTKEDITGKLFFWKKDGQKEKKEVFFYDSGIHYNNDLTGQDLQFKGRVSHFEGQLMNGDASIKIHQTKMADSGNYSCIFPDHSQTFYIQLVVERPLKDRSGETREDQSREVELWRMTAIVLTVLVALLAVAVVCWRCSDQWKIHLSEPIKSAYQYVISATSPYDMKQDNDCRASENPADTELTERTTTPPVMKLDNDRRASVNPADTELTQSNSHLRKMSPLDETEIIMPYDSDDESSA